MPSCGASLLSGPGGCCEYKKGGKPGSSTTLKKNDDVMFLCTNRYGSEMFVL